jgi:hypothetical protein
MDSLAPGDKWSGQLHFKCHNGVMASKTARPGSPMYFRTLNIPENKSFFLFGARGTGKTTWLKRQLSDSVYIDLLDAEIFTELLARPTRLSNFIPAGSKKNH